METILFWNLNLVIHFRPVATRRRPALSRYFLTRRIPFILWISWSCLLEQPRKREASLCFASISKLLHDKFKDQPPVMWDAVAQVPQEWGCSDQDRRLPQTRYCPFRAHVSMGRWWLMFHSFDWFRSLNWEKNPISTVIHLYIYIYTHIHIHSCWWFALLCGSKDYQDSWNWLHRHPCRCKQIGLCVVWWAPGTFTNHVAHAQMYTHSCEFLAIVVAEPWKGYVQTVCPPGGHTWARCYCMVAQLSSSNLFDGRTPTLDEQTFTKGKEKMVSLHTHAKQSMKWAEVKTEQHKAKASYNSVCLLNLFGAPATWPQSASPCRTTGDPNPAGAWCSSPYMTFSFQPT